MKSEARMSNAAQGVRSPFRQWDFVIPSDFVNRHSDLGNCGSAPGAFWGHERVHPRARPPPPHPRNQASGSRTKEENDEEDEGPGSRNAPSMNVASSRYHFSSHQTHDNIRARCYLCAGQTTNLVRGFSSAKKVEA